jgi:hypothetical protein
LNLRSAPDPSKKNVIAVLPQGAPVTRIADSATPDWFEVEAVVGGTTVRGFVNSHHLGPLKTAFPTAKVVAGKLPIADLGPRSGERRGATGTRAYQIQETGRPGKASTHSGGAAAGIVKIIDWLDVGKTSHLRWQGGGGKTFCNVYAYDVCIIAGAYLPRVWWTSKAIGELLAGKTVQAKYGQTVSEIRANYIFNWLVEYGQDFGWKQLFDVDSLQAEANSGRLGIVCAQRKNMEMSGHIQIVAPEHGSNKAKRNSACKVVQPLQSNAGVQNFTYGCLGTTWWQGASFRQYGFWTCDAG